MLKSIKRKLGPSVNRAEPREHKVRSHRARIGLEPLEQRGLLSVSLWDGFTSTLPLVPALPPAPAIDTRPNLSQFVQVSPDHLDLGSFAFNAPATETHKVKLSVTVP